MRRLVPTERQAREGDELDLAALEEALAAPDQPTRQPSRRERAAAQLAAVNPMGLDGPRLPIFVFCLSTFIAGADAATLTIIGPEIQAEFGLSIGALASIAAFTATLTAVVGLPVGYLVDRVKRVWIVRTTEVLGAVGDLVQATASSFGVLAAGRMTGALARIPEGGAIYPLLADYYPSRSRARVFGLIAAAATLGSLLAAPLMGWIVKTFGWRQASLTLALFAGATALLTFLLREPSRGVVDRSELGVSPELIEKAPPPPSFAEALRGAWSIKTLRLQSIAGFVQGFTLSVALVQSLVMSGTFGLDPLQRALFLTVTSALLLPALVLGACVADRLLQRRPSSLVTAQAWVAFATAAALAGSAFTDNLYVFLALSAVPVLSLGLLLPVTITVQSLVIPARFRGVGLKIGTPFQLAAALLAPALLAAVDSNDFQRSLLIFAPFGAVSGLLYLAAATGVSQDIRTARAAALAEEESERSRRERQNKILVCRDVDVAIDEVQILFRVDLDVARGRDRRAARHQRRRQVDPAARDLRPAAGVATAPSSSTAGDITYVPDPPERTGAASSTCPAARPSSRR